MPTAVVVSATFDSFSFATFVATAAILIGAAGALWRLDGTSVSRPLRPAGPDDTIVTDPLMVDLRRRVHTAWSRSSRLSGRPRRADGRG